MVETIYNTPVQFNIENSFFIDLSSEVCITERQTDGQERGFNTSYQNRETALATWMVESSKQQQQQL